MDVKRRAIQLSRQTLVVSLPSLWVKKHNIVKGDELDISLLDHELIVRTVQPKGPRGRRVCMSLNGLNDRTTRWVLSGLQKKGIDEIELTFDNPSSLHVVSDITKNLFVGMALVKQSTTSCVIKSLAHEDPSMFDITLRRAFQVTLSMADALLEALKENNYHSLESIRDLEKTNNQLTNFCERLLNTGVIDARGKTHFLYTIIWNLEKVGDDYKYICDHLLSHKTPITPEMCGFLSFANEFLRGYYELFYGFSLAKLNTLASQKDTLFKQAVEIIENTSYPENVVAIHLHNLIMKTLDFSTSMFAYHLQE